MKIRPLYIVLAVLALLALWLWAGYNGLVSEQLNVQNKWAQVQTTYQRRVDLIPNVVNTVKGSAAFESKTLQEVTAARTQWMQAGSMNDKVTAAQNLDGALARLLVTVEAYPQLKSTESFRDLTTELEGTENRINVARQDFNDAVQRYNLQVRRFPGNVVAKIFGFAPDKFFEAQAGADQAPKVDFGQ